MFGELLLYIPCYFFPIVDFYIECNQMNIQKLLLFHWAKNKQYDVAKFELYH